MEPIKIKGLDLKSESEVEEGDGESNEGKVENPVIKDDPNWGKSSRETAREITIQEHLTSIITRVEAWPKNDNTIKAIGKLKGALELLS